MNLVRLMKNPQVLGYKDVVEHLELEGMLSDLFISVLVFKPFA